MIALIAKGGQTTFSRLAAKAEAGAEQAAAPAVVLPVVF